MTPRKSYIIVNRKRINWIETAKGMDFSDGKSAIPTPGNIDPKLAYASAIPSKVKVIGNAELKVLRDVENQDFELKPGIYTDRCDIANLKNVSINGLGKVEFQTKQRAFEMKGDISHLSLGGFYTKNIQDYQIVLQEAWLKKYKDGAGDFFDGIRLFDIVSDNGGVLFHSNGALNKGVHEGMINNFEMSGCTVKNSANPGMVVYLGNARNYSLHDNIIDKVNTGETITDNGLFMANGNGKCFNNKVTNHQGRLIRAWLFSHDDTALVEIMNNYAYNSYKYSPFEIQVTPDMANNNYKPANAKVYNNTVGKMNTSKDWDGMLLDVYNTGGTLEYYNNLGFEMNRIEQGRNVTTGITDMINFAGGSPKIIRNEGNRYFDTYEQAMTFKKANPQYGSDLVL